MEENITRAQERDAVNQGMFYFRRNALPEDDDEDEGSSVDGDQSTITTRSHDHEYTLMSINTIMNGKASHRSHDHHMINSMYWDACILIVSK